MLPRRRQVQHAQLLPAPGFDHAHDGWALAFSGLRIFIRIMVYFRVFEIRAAPMGVYIIFQKRNKFEDLESTS